MGSLFPKTREKNYLGSRRFTLFLPFHLLLKIYPAHASRRPPAESMITLPISAMLWRASRLNELLRRRLILVVAVHVSVDQSHHRVLPNGFASLLPRPPHLPLMRPILFTSLERRPTVEPIVAPTSPSSIPSPLHDLISLLNSGLDRLISYSATTHDLHAHNSLISAPFLDKWRSSTMLQTRSSPSVLLQIGDTKQGSTVILGSVYTIKANFCTREAVIRAHTFRT